jgi:hypothetical protein
MLTYSGSLDRRLACFLRPQSGPGTWVGPRNLLRQVWRILTEVLQGVQMRNARGRTTAVGRVALVTCLAFVLASVHGAEAQPSSYPKKVSLDGPWSYRALAHTTLKADGSIPLLRLTLRHLVESSA